MRRSVEAASKRRMRAHVHACCSGDGRSSRMRHCVRGGRRSCQPRWCAGACCVMVGDLWRARCAAGRCYGGLRTYVLASPSYYYYSASCF